MKVVVPQIPDNKFRLEQEDKLKILEEQYQVTKANHDDLK